MIKLIFLISNIAFGYTPNVMVNNSNIPAAHGSASITGSSSGCVVNSQVFNLFSACVRNSTGNYTVTFTTGLFSASSPPHCTATVIDATNYVLVKLSAVPTSTGFTYSMATLAVLPYDGTVDWVCTGGKPYGV